VSFSSSIASLQRTVLYLVACFGYVVVVVAAVVASSSRIESSLSLLLVVTLHHTTRPCYTTVLVHSSIFHSFIVCRQCRLGIRRSFYHDYISRNVVGGNHYHGHQYHQWWDDANECCFRGGSHCHTKVRMLSAATFKWDWGLFTQQRRLDWERNSLLNLLLLLSVTR
jgi:hypothetical protein